jgi:hypothetical protein
MDQQDRDALALFFVVETTSSTRTDVIASPVVPRFRSSIHRREPNGADTATVRRERVIPRRSLEPASRGALPSRRAEAVS